MQLNVYDMDGTIVDSTAALRQCQIEGMYRATGQDASQLELLLKDKGLKGALAHLNIDQDTFFKTHYKTFDPFAAAKDGRMKVFEDAWKALEFTYYCNGEMQTDYMRDCLISNSTVEATLKKLDAVHISDRFNFVFAEVEKDKAKPTSYMAIQLRDKLIDEKKLNDVSYLVNIGDMPVDMEFGDVLYDTLATASKNKIAFQNYLIDRAGSYTGTLPKSAKIISSLR
jgi:phosphoglycolate phosphatase-like HAD superfamily hydrolase